MGLNNVMFGDKTEEESTIGRKKGESFRAYRKRVRDEKRPPAVVISPEEKALNKRLAEKKARILFENRK